MIYKIELCSEENKPRLIEFIRKYWKEDHVFVKSDELFRFQHYNPIHNNYTFPIGINTITNEIDGIGGLIPVAHYDPDLTKYNDTWGGIWKIRPDVHNDEIGLLGVMLFETVDAYNSHASIGMSPIAWKLHKLRKYTMGYMSQYYILNDECDDFFVAKVPDCYKGKRHHFTNTCEYKLVELENLNGLTDADIQHSYYPMKSLRYLINRFQLHPIYKYHFWGLYHSNVLQAIFIGRIINVDGHNVIRIMDVYGKLEGLSSIYSEVQKLLKKHQAEYLDCLNYGIDSSVFDEMGFDLLDVNGDIIIPNYFEPFLQENIALNCAYKANFHYTMFKADSDQDRPNII
jgi:hypothetical protein